MRIALLAAVVIAAANVAVAQSPAARLPGQAEPSTGPFSSGSAMDEVTARRKLEDRGYRDLRNVTPNGDGGFSAQAVRQNPPGRQLPGTDRDIRIEIDSAGNVRER